MILDLTLLPKAPVVTLMKYFGGLDEHVLRPMTWIVLSLPDFEVVTFNSGGNFTQIVLVDAAINANGGPNFVFDYASARDSMGFDFITVV